ncbi:MAG: hypothetical protein LQ345_004433 [Seirophora villosa]|nr:MAG: hypothetical protein LQ345_004433 [Seirophora villosa]
MSIKTQGSPYYRGYSALFDKENIFLVLCSSHHNSLEHHAKTAIKVPAMKYTNREMEAAVALVNLSSPSPSPSDTTLPHITILPRAAAPTTKQQRKSIIHPQSDEDRFLVEGRRAGMTPSQLKASPNLPSFRDRPVHQIKSRLNKLRRAGYDIAPRTAEARKRSDDCGNREQIKEMNAIADACRRGMTPKEILAAGIVRHGRMDEKGLAQRIYRMGLRGLDVKPRQERIRGPIP